MTITTRTELGVANALSVLTQSVSLWGMGLHRVVICFAHRKSDGGGTRILHHRHIQQLFYSNGKYIVLKYNVETVQIRR